MLRWTKPGRGLKLFGAPVEEVPIEVPITFSYFFCPGIILLGPYLTGQVTPQSLV